MMWIVGGVVAVLFVVGVFYVLAGGLEQEYLGDDEFEDEYEYPGAEDEDPPENPLGLDKEGWKGEKIDKDG